MLCRIATVDAGKPAGILSQHGENCAMLFTIWKSIRQNCLYETVGD